MIAVAPKQSKCEAIRTLTTDFDEYHQALIQAKYVAFHVVATSALPG